MQTQIFKTREESGKRAAELAQQLIQDAIKARGAARVILATGASQFDFIATLVTLPVDWSKVEAFHLDEYSGMPDTHPASFRKYLRERFVAKVKNLKAFHWVAGDAPSAQAECKRLNALISSAPVDVGCVGIGENAHLAFNDPPADFETEEPFIEVKLDEACRRQQLGEGWFKTLDDVPKLALTMTIRQIMKSRTLIVTVPDQRKAQAVKLSVEGPVTNMVPSSILQQHPRCELFLDAGSASLLKGTRA